MDKIKSKILNANMDEIRAYFDKNYKTQTRPKGGFYVLGNETEIVDKAKRMMETACLDANLDRESVIFNYCEIYGENDNVVGVALFI